MLFIQPVGVLRRIDIALITCAVKLQIDLDTVHIGMQLTMAWQVVHITDKARNSTSCGASRSVYPAVYFLPPALLAACGYTAVMVNFRGSQGFGEDNIQSLPGNVGVHDVADCIAALDAAVAAGMHSNIMY